jgi:ankyrin repeat protein
MAYSAQLQGASPTFRQHFPFIGSPAVKNYQIDAPLILKRAYTEVALSFIALGAVSWGYGPVSLSLLAIKYRNIVPFGTSCLLPVLTGVVEYLRARSAADRLAVEEYMSKEHPSTEAMDRICSSLGAFKRLIDNQANLHKKSTDEQTVVDKMFSSSASEEVFSFWVNSEELDANGKSFFIRALQCYSSSFYVEAILKTGKVKVENFTDTEQAKIWTHVRNAESVKLLCDYKFNINARDKNQRTPLMNWAKDNSGVAFNLATAALSAGADPILEDNGSQKAYQLAKPGSLMEALLLPTNHGKRDQLLPKEKWPFSWLPWKPFVCKGASSYRVDYHGLQMRTMLVGAAALVSVAILPHSMFWIAMSVSYLALSLISIEGLWRSRREADRLAVVDFLKNPVPSEQATGRICESANAARLLAEYAIDSNDLNKFDEAGKRLLTHVSIELEPFKHLVVKGGQKVLLPDVFKRVVQNKDPACLAFILDRKMVDLTMPSKQQVEMWSSIGSKQAAEFLKNYGFGPNVQDEEGNTALMKLAQQKNFYFSDSLDKMRILLAIGANKALKNKAEKTALDLAATESARKLLQKQS